MAYVFRSKRKDGAPYGPWRFQFTDWTGRRRTATASASKTRTEKLAQEVDLEHRLIRQGLRPAPDPHAEHKRRPFSELAAEYCEWGESQGGRGGRPWSATHARMRRTYLAWWRDSLHLTSLGDLGGCLPRVEKVLRDLQGKGLSNKTVRNYAEALMAFCGWGTMRGYLTENPLRGLRGFDTTPGHRRRALTPEEIGRLLEVAPPDRRILYQVALCSGLRANELRSLTPADLDTQKGGLLLRPEWTKNRKGGFQPLPVWLLRELADYATRDRATAAYREAYEQAHAVTEAPAGRLLFVPSHPAGSFDEDCAAAGIPKRKLGGKVDFHALRTTFVTLLDGAGGSVKETQTLARHADPALTWNVYGRASEERLAELAAVVGEVARGRVRYPESIQGAVRRMAVGAQVYEEQEDRMVGAAGFEPAISSPPC